ncbi:DDE-type integrase/transposase/recombinase, partial [Corallococcus interemptor]
MDLKGPTKFESINGKKYIFLTVEDFSRLTWVRFLHDKLETFTFLNHLWSLLVADKRQEFGVISRIRSDHGIEFQNSNFSTFYTLHGIKHEFSAPKTPQQNGVVERKNRMVQEMAQVMLHSKNIPQRFWAKAVNTAVYVINHVYLKPGTKTTPY